MKISFTWIVIAIVVILIVIVGAFTLSNGNKAPASNATATATPTTTITPIPTVLASPTAAPSTAATATPVATTSPTPTATPTITGSNGVEQTSYGYYITYPPFESYQINANPNYVISNGSPTPSASPTPSIVTFNTEYGGVFCSSTGSFPIIENINVVSSDNTVKIYVPLSRTIGISNALTVQYGSQSEHNLNEFSTAGSVSFAAGQSSTTIEVDVPLSWMEQHGAGHLDYDYVDLTLQPSSTGSYTIGNINPFHLNLNSYA